MPAPEQIQPGTDNGYSHEHRPLAAYSALTAVFGAGFIAAMTAALKRRGAESPQPRPFDIVLIAAATHQVSRLITKKKVTSTFRAPFVRYQGSAGQGEVDEEPRGEGLRLAIGELLVCPYCVGHWVASGFGVGLVASPELTRLIATIFAAESAAEFLQMAYKGAEDATS